ncbi:CTP synthetase [Natrialbaceae archaeon A-CW2]
MYAIIAGPDEDDLAGALETHDVRVERLNGTDPISRPLLEEAGIVDADLYVLTDVSESTTIPIVRDLTDEIRTVVYDRNTIPEFIRGQLDLALDPELITVEMLAEELTGNGAE